MWEWDVDTCDLVCSKQQLSVPLSGPPGITGRELLLQDEGTAYSLVPARDRAALEQMVNRMVVKFQVDQAKAETPYETEATCAIWLWDAENTEKSLRIAESGEAPICNS